jgi:hypothetical protein
MLMAEPSSDTCMAKEVQTAYAESEGDVSAVKGQGRRLKLAQDYTSSSQLDQKYVSNRERLASPLPVAPGRITFTLTSSLGDLTVNPSNARHHLALA